MTKSPIISQVRHARQDVDQHAKERYRLHDPEAVVDRQARVIAQFVYPGLAIGIEEPRAAGVVQEYAQRGWPRSRSTSSWRARP